MPLTVAVQMDPIERINIAGDSTFALILEAQARGHELLHYTPDRVHAQRQGQRRGCEPLDVRDVEWRSCALGEASLTDLSTVDVVLLRQDPPFDLAYIATTHILERVHPKTLRRQRSGRRAQRAGEDVRHRVSRTSCRRPSSPVIGRRSRRSATSMARW